MVHILLRRLWEGLGLHDGIVKSLKSRKFKAPVEWAIFAMVAKRTLAPDSKRADLLNLEVDLLFFDTTSTYMEMDEEDEEGLRRYGNSRDRSQIYHR